jgi:hypothetical protein
MNGLPDVCFPSPFNDSGLFWQKEWGKESITVNKCYCLEGWSSWYGWSCLCGPLQYYATWWRPSGLCIYLTCSLLPHIEKNCYGLMEVLKYSLFSVPSWMYCSALLAWLIHGLLLIPIIHTTIKILFSGWILCKRNVPCSLWMLGDKLHCKQAFQGQCSKFKINSMPASYCGYTLQRPIQSCCFAIFRGLCMHMSLSLGARLATCLSCDLERKSLWLINMGYGVPRLWVVWRLNQGLSSL